MTTTELKDDPAASAAHGHGDHAHGDPEAHLAHHFDTPQQQFDSGKLGIWLFLVTEILFFSGLFCAYAIYRANHPEVFVYASRYLDTFWGAFNTIVLIFSSLTAAWAVRNAQLGQQRALVINIVLTIACAFGFLSIKYVEYSHKWHEGLLPGAHYTHNEAEFAERFGGTDHAAATGGAAGAETPATGGEAAQAAPPAGEGNAAAATTAEHGAHGAEQADDLSARPDNVHIFFSVYFFMTGLHGFHVIAGIVVWLWMLKRALRGEFGPKYFGPIDYAALYWHIVDLIWIYLFPLLYLIH